LVLRNSVGKERSQFSPARRTFGASDHRNADKVSVTNVVINLNPVFAKQGNQFGSVLVSGNTYGFNKKVLRLISVHHWVIFLM
jgi:hypothetical protein